jgi:hypothetical protein
LPDPAPSKILDVRSLDRTAAMHEPDDRLAGDPVWELFPSPAQAPPPRRLRLWLATAVIVAAAWIVSPPLAVLIACLAASLGEFRKGRQLRRAIPDKAGGGICSLFSYAWGAWRLGAAAFVLFATILAVGLSGGENLPPSGFFAAAMLWLAGFTASAALTATGLVKAFRSGMRVWIGEGVNQARTLMIGMLLVGFTFAWLSPLLYLSLVAHAPRPNDGERAAFEGVWVAVAMFAGFSAFFLGAAVVILLLVDWFSRRILADRPGKFGPKVPTVGKWDC